MQVSRKLTDHLICGFFSLLLVPFFVGTCQGQEQIFVLREPLCFYAPGYAVWKHVRPSTFDLLTLKSEDIALKDWELCNGDQLDEGGEYAWHYPTGAQAEFLGFYDGKAERVSRQEASQLPISFAEVQIDTCANAKPDWESEAALKAFGAGCDSFPMHRALIPYKLWEDKYKGPTVPSQ